MRALDRIGVGIDDISVASPTLDDAFLKLTGRHTDADADNEDSEPGTS